MKILLLTNELSVLRIIRALTNSAYIIVGLFPSKDNSFHAIREVLEKSQIEYWQIDNIKAGSLEAKMCSAQIDLLLTFRCPKIVPEAVISAARLGGFNLHTGLLPNYAGLNVPSWAIFNGEATHGVTLHRLAAGIDTGEIIMTESFSIGPRETGISLTGQCVRAGSRLMSLFVNKLLSEGKCPLGIPQELDRRHYYSKDIPGSGRIDWSWDAIRLDRLIRASNFYPFVSPWGIPLAQLNSVEIGILSAEPLEASSHSTSVGTVIDVTENCIDVTTINGVLRIYEVTEKGMLIDLKQLAL